MCMDLSRHQCSTVQAAGVLVAYFTDSVVSSISMHSPPAILVIAALCLLCYCTIPHKGAAANST